MIKNTKYSVYLLIKILFIFGIEILPLYAVEILQSQSSSSLGLKAVILDWAGTTVDYGSNAPVAAFKQVFAERGVPITDQEVRKPMGVDKRTHIKLIAENAAIPPEKLSVGERWKAKYAHYPTEKDIDNMFQRFTPLLKEILADTKLIPGTLETISFIQNKGWKIGTTTGYTADQLTIVANAAKKKGFHPDINVTSDMVKHARPYPDMIWLLSSKFQIPTSDMVKIDDTISGIEEGRNAGTWTIMVLKSGNALGLDEASANKLSPEELTKRLEPAIKQARQVAHFTVNSIQDVPLILMKIDTLIRKGEYPFQYEPMWAMCSVASFNSKKEEKGQEKGHPL